MFSQTDHQRLGFNSDKLYLIVASVTMSQSLYRNARSIDLRVVVVAVALVAVDLLDGTHKRNDCMMAVVADTYSDLALGSSTSYKLS